MMIKHEQEVWIGVGILGPTQGGLIVVQAAEVIVNMWVNKFCNIRMNIKSKIVMCFIGVFLVMYIFIHVNMEKKYLKDTNCL